MLNEKPARREFTCTKCGKHLQLMGLAYTKAYEGHDTCLSCRTTEKPDKVLTEDELNKIADAWETATFDETDFEALRGIKVISGLITSHRTLNSRNAKLVHENDELMAENEKLKTALHEITQVDTDYFEDDAKLMTKFAEEALEELNHE